MTTITPRALLARRAASAVLIRERPRAMLEAGRHPYSVVSESGYARPVLVRLCIAGCLDAAEQAREQADEDACAAVSAETALGRALRALEAPEEPQQPDTGQMVLLPAPEEVGRTAPGVRRRRRRAQRVVADLFGP